MADFFEEEDYKEEEPKKVEEEAQIELDLDNTNIDSLIIYRNKIVAEYNDKMKEYEERIGRYNLEMFGDPNNPDFESRLHKFDDELDHPLTSTHPIARKGKEFVKGIKDLQREYNNTLKYIKHYMRRSGKLLDVCLIESKKYRHDMLNMKEKIKEITDKIKEDNKGVIDKEKQEYAKKEELYKHKILILQDEIDRLKAEGYLKRDMVVNKIIGEVPKEKIEEFMNTMGLPIIIDAVKAKKEGDMPLYWAHKGKFISFVMNEFTASHKDPKALGIFLFDTYDIGGKNKDLPISPYKNAPDSGQPDLDPLIDTSKTEEFIKEQIEHEQERQTRFDAEKNGE